MKVFIAFLALSQYKHTASGRRKRLLHLNAITPILFIIKPQRELRINLGFSFFANSILLGTGLAMDAFSVSLANGLNEPKMKKHKVLYISGIFALFQFAMPLSGWFFVSTMAEHFKAFEKFIPFIALALLGYIGFDMLRDGIKHKDEPEEKPAVGLSGLLIQGAVTSIDALSVGFTISVYNFIEALISCLIIGIVTFFICFAGILIGKKAGTALAGKAGVFGGIILIFIGLEIFISNLI